MVAVFGTVETQKQNKHHIATSHRSPFESLPYVLSDLISSLYIEVYSFGYLVRVFCVYAYTYKHMHMCVYLCNLLFCNLLFLASHLHFTISVTFHHL